MTYEVPVGRDAIGYETITVSNTPVALTAAEYTVTPSSTFSSPMKAGRAIISVEAQSLRWTIWPGDTVSDSANGHIAAALDVIVLNSPTQVANFRAIRSTGSDSTIRVTYFAN